MCTTNYNIIFYRYIEENFHFPYVNTIRNRKEKSIFLQAKLDLITSDIIEQLS